MKLSVVLGADALVNQRSGIGRVTLEVARALLREPELAAMRLWIIGRLYPPTLLDTAEDQTDLPVSDGPTAKPKPIRRTIGLIPGVQAVRARYLWWLMRGGLKDLAKASGDRVVYHETNMVANRFPGTTVVQMNDLSWHHHPELHPPERIAWIERNLARTLRQATRFVAISAFTADALAQEFSVPRARIDVVPLAASAVFHPRAADDAAVQALLARHGLQDRSYVLSVSTLEPRKNFDRLVAAHLALPARLREQFPLVIAGGSGWGARLATAASAQAERAGTLRLLGFVPDDELAILTARAAVFPYVSLYEGFGLPVLEAMLADTPVIASATTATGETAGSAALLVDPRDVDAIAAALRAVLEDATLAASLRARGLAHAATFGWQRTARDLIASWNRALAAPR